MDDKQTVIKELKAYLNDPSSRINLKGQPALMHYAYIWGDVSEILMGQGYSGTVKNVIDRLIELLEE